MYLPSTIIFILFLLLLPPTSSTTITNFSHNQNTTTLLFTFPSFTLRNITLLGDSFLRDGVVGLTLSTPVPASSCGSLLYNNPITATGPSLFSLFPSFSVYGSDTTSTTNSSTLSFFHYNFVNLDIENRPMKITSTNTTPTTSSSTFTFFLYSSHNLSLIFHPNDDNHLTLDLTTPNSTLTNIPTTFTDLNTQNNNIPITSWLDYHAHTKKLNVFLNYSSVPSSKPQNPILSVDLDLSHYFKDNLYVGFSGSTLGSTELVQVMSWSFEFESFQKPGSNLHPDNGSRTPASVAVSDIPSPSNSTEGNSYNRGKRFFFGVAVAIAGPAFFCVVLVVLGYVSFLKWRGVRKLQKSFGTVGCCPKEFGYKEVKLATKGFHPSRVIGKGSFGTVYKALFESSGTIAAVKRSRQYSHEGRTEFLAELSVIAGLRHKNLVQLLGWCVEKGELLLVYEFMPNGSLDKVLYQECESGNNSNNVLSWNHRVNIAVGLASVLSYLHQECEQRVIHRDIKTGNILLDGSMNPRLGDFGLAKLMDHDKSPVSTLTAGTMGYLAPEYLQCGMANEKTDVFSYGVVVLEVACGRRPIEREGQKMVNLVDWVWGLHSQGTIIEAADKRLNGDFREGEMKRLLLLGLSCANPDSAQRPSMRRVLQILNNNQGVALVVPKEKPTLTFSSGLPLSLDEIVSDAEEELDSGQVVCEIKID
ncbi:probable L-type lectin-domain containing receptor kinase S.7 [Glycine max]|uniref:probable L-type lectin-domain containing receptor kinase S.7 n=1 Tax=Glycine max TaxID=3847 RepID=UPI001B354F0F|nr:probable L-type lectin-domain containing receptor kinase S.7 [Glycine max]